jgi:hypothetical protein
MGSACYAVEVGPAEDLETAVAELHEVLGVVAVLSSEDQCRHDEEQ